jgi:hypothetical protein
MRRLPPRLMLFAGFALSAGAVRAELSCPQPVAQAGKVRAGAPLVQRYTLFNRGPEVIDIQELRSSCGCMSPHLKERRLQPGDKVEVDLEVNTLTQAAGPHSWRLQVFHRQGNVARELSLYLSAHVIQEISVQPPSLTFFTDVQTQQDLTIVERLPQPLAITSVQAPPHVRARLDEPQRDKDGHWKRALHLEVLADHPEGRHEERLHIRCNDPLYPDLSVPITIIKRSPHQVLATPSSVQLAAFGGEPLPARIVLLACADEQPVRIEGIECRDPAVHCTWAAGPGARATLRVQVDRDRVVGDRLRGVIKVHLREPKPQTLEIPISCTVH